ncbi:MAG TPA: c-type cytochrome [Burkholderiaceae bacterium]|nr:c-type cytochrome [Burkholderiaceae bacterium]
MKRQAWTKLAAVCLLTGVTGMVLAQQPKLDFGKREYDNNCAACHGKAGKGDGVYVDLLRKSAPDLTTMAKRNGGVFPMARAYDVIDGGGTGHGTRDMPIWGQEYSVQAANFYMDVPYDQQAYVRSRILALAEYLNRLQAR